MNQENINNNLDEKAENKNPAKVINMFSREKIDSELAKYDTPSKIIKIFSDRNPNLKEKIEKVAGRTNDAIKMMAYNYKMSGKDSYPKNFA